MLRRRFPHRAGPRPRALAARSGKVDLVSFVTGVASGAFLAEVVLTAPFAVLGATSKTANATTAGMVVGLSLTVVHLIGIPITGTSVNPARSLGPALIVGGTALNQVWLFIVAPLIGGALAAGLRRLLYPEPQPQALASGEIPTPSLG